MTFGTGIEKIPQSIVRALCAVQASVDAVAKTQYNKQGGYKFASTDDIYAAVARKFGEVGLTILPLELSQPEIQRVEKTDSNGELKVSQWGKFHFGFVLATEDDTWFDERLSRAIFIQILGPQTFNAAESYCQKQFLRGVLKLPTGDMDLDGMPQSETEEGQIALVGGGKRKSSSSAKKDGTDKVFNEIKNDIQTAINREMLMHIRETRADEWNAMPRAWVELLEHEYEDRMESFGSHREAAE
ncbi:ERF family protein [Hyphomicrobium sp. MC1]|uniref:ERF family protein n=1 Tax=Hyphomicrobium sp. (strain MC1) TaxID=717785 RepID=UPI000213DA91|nr:ERF family protein [Hyphomicrobium sp. MC1]CCB64438.1 protein of unknown function [Hyphomicrobium sp. MC1]